MFHQKANKMIRYNTNNDQPSNNNTLDYYFSHATSDHLNSNEIPGWNEYIKAFLVSNNLDKYVKSISINNGVITCTLINNKTFNYTNVTSVVDLLKKLKTSLSNMNEGGNA